MTAELTALPINESVPITRAFSQFLMLTAQAETHHRSVEAHAAHLKPSLKLAACNFHVRRVLQLHRRTQTISTYQILQSPGAMSALMHAVRGCSVRTSRIEGVTAKTCDEVFATLISQGISPEDLHKAVCKQARPIDPTVLVSQQDNILRSCLYLMWHR